MKKIVFLLAGASLSSAALAQGYVGALVSLTRLSDGCVDAARCSGTKASGFKIFAGTRLAPGQSLDLGVAKINRIEVSAMRMGRVNSRSTITEQSFNEETFELGSRDVAIKDELKGDALTVAAVAEIPVINKLNLLAKVGAAYVTATKTTFRDGRRDNSKSNNSIRPYLGLGVEYAVLNELTLVGNFDWTRYAVDGRSGSATQLGLGASVSF